MSENVRKNRPRARRTKAFEKLPINKGVHGDAADVPRLPQINNPVTIGVLAFGAKMVRPLIRNLQPSRRLGRPERFRQRLLRTIHNAPVIAEIERAGGFDVQVDVQESFGKPTLVSVDLCVPAEATLIEERLRDSEHKGLRLLLSDLLARMVETVWDNPEIAPVAIRGRIIMGQETVLLDMTALGYVDEIARPHDLYDLYGAPASDPGWHP